MSHLFKLQQSDQITPELPFWGFLNSWPISHTTHDIGFPNIFVIKNVYYIRLNLSNDFRKLIHYAKVNGRARKIF